MNVQSNEGQSSLHEYNNLISAYRAAYPQMSLLDAQSAVRGVWNEWKQKHGLGMYSSSHMCVCKIHIHLQ